MKSVESVGGRDVSMKPPWPRVKLGEVCEIVSARRVHKAEWKHEGIPFYRAREIVKLADYGKVDNELFISEELYEKYKNSSGVPTANDLMVSAVGSIGRVYVVKENDKFYYKDASVLCFENKKGQNAAFLKYQIESPDFNKMIHEKSGGATVDTITIERAREYEIVLPPLAIQREIVARLERELGAVEKVAKKFEELERAAEAEFKATLKETFEEISRGGAETRRLGEVCENLDYKRVPITKVDRRSGRYPYYGASGIVDYVADYIFDGDYLLVSEDGANLVVRSMPIAFSVSGKIWVNNHAHVLSFTEFVTRKYVEYFFAITDISELITGAAQPKLTQKALNGISLPLPPLAVQREIVARLDGARGRRDGLVAAAKRGREAAELWRKAILKEAFE